MNRPRQFLALCAVTAAATASAAAQNTIPVRALTPAAQTDSGLLKTVVSIRPLSDGRVLVNDNLAHRVLIFDESLKRYSVVMDSGVAGVNRYSAQAMDITPYLADSTLLLDQSASAFVVVSPKGEVARTMALPFPGGMLNLIGFFGAVTRGFDPQGRLIWRRLRSMPPRGPAPPPDTGKVTITVTHDSMAIVRIDFDTKQVDTLGLVANATSKSIQVALGGGGYSGSSAPNPFPLPDEWALLPDGTVAIVRGRDYHIDWVAPDGTRTSTPRMAFDWKRIPEQEKQRMADSLRAAAEARYAQTPATRPSFGGGPPITMPKVPPVWFEPPEMEDYYPPIRANTVKSDPEGNVWVLPTTSMLAGNGLVYDLVNRKGEVFERVRLPANRNLVAVGKGGVVYMSYTPARGVAYLERAVIVR